MIEMEFVKDNEINLSPTEMITEINRLKQQNKQLELEKNEWRDNYITLHNKVINKEIINIEDGKAVLDNKLISNLSLEDLELTESFFNNSSEVQALGYDPDEMFKAYAEAEKNCRM